MISKTVVVNLPADAEARPVAVLVQIASKYESKITINSQNRRINAKSIAYARTSWAEASQ